MTLDKGKSYGQEQIQQTLQDKARTRLNNPAPHQAPQRDRVSRVTYPSARAGGPPRNRNRRWKSLIRTDVNMGVPQLMMILEPNIVWEHTKGFTLGVGKEVEANVTPGEFFDGWHKGGRRAYGVYEGSYWDLLGDCDEISEMLRKLSKAPALLEEPPLELPPPSELPSWDDFKPNLHIIPASPVLPPLKLPPFRAPILEPEPPFMEPELLPVPTVPPAPKEEPLPIFVPPEFMQIEPLKEPEYVDPAPPTTSDAPPPPEFGKPKHGHDWTGERPFQLDMPSRDIFMSEAASKRVIDTSRFVHPPANLPLLPQLEPVDVDLLQGLDLEPIPRLELAWMGGPEPDPPYASVPSSPAALSRGTSRPPSRPMSATPSPLSETLPSPFGDGSSASTPPSSAKPRVSSAASQRKSTLDDGSSRPWSAGAGGEGSMSRTRSAIRRSATASSGAASIRSPQATVKTPEDLAWEDARSVGSEASGTPRMWVNFSAPFADLPPIMMPPRPEPGPEPIPEEFPHEPLEDLPTFVPPMLLEAPQYVEPPQFVPQWAAPCEPRPVGFLRGTAPLLICDVSGTMNSRQQGRFREMKRCAVDLLDPEGEIATAAAGFDVINFSGSAWSWSAGYGERMGLLQSSQVPYSGRQVGGRYSSKTPPNQTSRGASPERFRTGAAVGTSTASGATAFGGGSGLAMMPTQPDLLSDAQRWVANWPDAVGTTNLLAAFLLAERHAGADCWYVLSDGMAHDQQACLEFLTKRAEAGCMPVIHCIGFIAAEANPDTAGERFLRGLADLTGGSYQRYTPDIVKVWEPGQGFVRFDTNSELPEQREERQWAEKQLRAERIRNLRLGIAEPLEVTLERVSNLHKQLRVVPAVHMNELAVLEARRRYSVAVESVRLSNERRMMTVKAAHDEALAAVRTRNQGKVDAARESFLQSHGDWERDYLERLQDWEDAKATLERQREEQLSAANVIGTPSRPQSAVVQPYTSATGNYRPTSANAYAALPKSKSGSGLIPLAVELSEQRAVYAAAEYDAAMKLEQLAAKLSPSPLPTPPGSRPMSAYTVASSGSRPMSALKTVAAGSGSRPVSGVKSVSDAAVAVEAGLGGGGGVSEYLEAITEDMAEASAPLDAVYTDVRSGGDGTAAVTGLDDDGIDVRPSRTRSAGVGGRDQNSAGRRPPSASTSTSRPVSARGSSRLTSARSGTSSASGGTGPGTRPPSGLGMLPEETTVLPSPLLSPPSESFLQPPPPLPEPSAALQPLRGERSDEFKRRLLPTELVEEHDAANSARLQEIHNRWEALVSEDISANSGRKLAAMRRNAAQLEDYRTTVYEAYANSLIRDVVYGGAVRLAANLAIMDNAHARYLAELERVKEENARLRELHASEVEQKRAKEDLHVQASRRWQDVKDAAHRQHEADRQKAKAEHEANINRLKAEWRAKAQQILELNDSRLTEAEALHESLVEQVKENNRKHKDAHAELVRQRKDVETANSSRLSEAKTVHKVRLEARAADNERLIRSAMEEHQAMCVRLQEEFEESKAQSEVNHTELCAFLRTANEQLTEEARRRYQDALAEVQAAYEVDCVAAREAHTRDLERVRRYNQEIWPKVHVARLAQAELARVQLFAEHIRYCANKFELGVNLLPNTPNYDRVVEMQALTEALAKAFPDTPASALPWPDHERRLEPGTGWVAAPAARTLSYRDPMEIINRIARGKVVHSARSPPSGPSRGDSPATTRDRPGTAHSAIPTPIPLDGDPVEAASLLTTSGSVDDLPPSHTQQAAPSRALHQQQPSSAHTYTPRHLTRPLSAGRARFASVINSDLASLRPMSAMVPAPCSAHVEAWGAAAAIASSSLSSPGIGAGNALRPQSGGGAYQNPSAWRRSNTFLLRNGSPRAYAASHLGGGSIGPQSMVGGASMSMVAAVAAAAATTAAMGGMTSRPETARPGTAHSTAGGSSGASRPRSAGPSARPPARVAVDVAPLAASMARSKAQAGSHSLTAGALAGFAKDVPKLRYPEVDIPHALTIASSLRSQG